MSPAPMVINTSPGRSSRQQPGDWLDANHVDRPAAQRANPPGQVGRGHLSRHERRLPRPIHVRNDNPAGILKARGEFVQ